MAYNMTNDNKYIRFDFTTGPSFGLTCTQNGYTEINIDDYAGGTVVVSSPGWDEGLCYGSDLDCRFTVYTERPGYIIELKHQETYVSA